MKTAARVLSITGLSFLLSGCLWAAIGGAAATGAYVLNDERSASQIAKDTAITSGVKAKFIRDEYIKALDINVDTRNGNVVLFGNVPNQEIENHAVLLARSVKNVVGVTSRMVIVPKPY
ncbi:MAG: BON domain-containing protein [Proteobacteria bacterium]|nr:BON domain-containing protein [Pseudomonadota bacterium]